MPQTIVLCGLWKPRLSGADDGKRSAVPVSVLVDAGREFRQRCVSRVLELLHQAGLRSVITVRSQVLEQMKKLNRLKQSFLHKLNRNLNPNPNLKRFPNCL